jgi:hypothetical protein
MKSKYLVFGLVLALTCFATSCEKEPDIEIPDPSETEGDQRDRFVGNWTVTENRKLSTSSVNFQVNISKDDQFPTRVNISNFYSIGTTDTVIATISAVLVDAITVTDQTVSASFFSGTGEMENDQKINMSYIVDDGNANVDSVTAVLIR